MKRELPRALSVPALSHGRYISAIHEARSLGARTNPGVCRVRADSIRVVGRVRAAVQRPARPIATIVFKNRRALSSWVWDSELNFGETYMFARRGDSRRPSRNARSDIPCLRYVETSALVACGRKSHDVRAAKENVHRHYDLGNEFYRLWLDRRDGLHVRLLPDAGVHARGGADREDGSRLPEAPAARRASASSKPGAAGARWRCSWRSTTASRCGRSTSSTEQIAYARKRAHGGGARPIASNSSRTTTAT